MQLIKKEYIDGETVISADNLNDIQDAIIELQNDETGGGTGADGKSAYEIACDYGFEGTEEEWLASLKGETGAAGADGKDGAKGEKGDTGAAGSQGEKGEKGDPGNDYVLTEKDKEEIAQMAVELLPVYDGSYTDLVEEYDGTIIIT